jgi:hypothetical protein
MMNLEEDVRRKMKEKIQQVLLPGFTRIAEKIIYQNLDDNGRK